MNGTTTPLDAVIVEKLGPYAAAKDSADVAEREARERGFMRNELEGELQRLIIARSILRDGKACAGGDANVELAKLLREARP